MGVLIGTKPATVYRLNSAKNRRRIIRKEHMQENCKSSKNNITKKVTSLITTINISAAKP